MDIQLYFRKKREIESNIPDPFVIVMSMDTADGGKGGRLTEVSRGIAAQLIVEGRSRLATGDEVRAYQEEAVRAREEAANAASPRFPLAVLSDQDLRSLRSSLKLQKG